MNKKRISLSLGIFILLFTFSILGLSEVKALTFTPQVGIPDTPFDRPVSFESQGNSGTGMIINFIAALYD